MGRIGIKKGSKSCIKKSKSYYEGLLEGYEKLFPDPARVCKYNYDLYKNASRLAKSSCTQSHKKSSKKVREPSYLSSLSSINNRDIFPADTYDTCGCLVQNGTENLQIQAVLKFDGRLDQDKLSRSVKLSIEAEPVLGYRFAEDERSYRKQLDNINEADFFSLEEAENTDDAVKSFLQSPLDINNGTNLKVKVIRSKQNDILVLKINNACCDGTGVKKYIQLLCGIYSNIENQDGTFSPETESSLIGNSEMLVEELNKICPETNQLSLTPQNMWPFQWDQNGEDSICFSVVRLPFKSLDWSYHYGNLKGTALNDLILTAFYRAMGKITKPSNGTPLAIASSVDLRRFIPGYAQEISNLTGGYITRVPLLLYESFAGTLSKVTHETKNFKERSLENVNTVFSHNFYKLLEETSDIRAQNTSEIHDVCIPGLIDSGNISDSFIRFGENYVVDAYFIPPVIRAPGFLLLASSYNDVLTLSLGWNKGSVSQSDMDSLLNKIKYELVRGF